VSSAALALRRVSPRRLAVVALRSMSPRLKRRLLMLAVACVALALTYQLWFRDSSLVEVQRVQVTGLTSSDAKRVRAALTSEAKTMTTLHVDRAALERAVEVYPVIRAIEVTPDFPHGLRIHAIEYQPAAIAVAGGTRVPVAGDGTILRGVSAEGHLPTVQVEGAIGDKILDDPTARGAAAIAGAAPAVLRSRIDDVEHTGEGFVANLRDGPELIFGRPAQLRAKWAAAARILADLDARGASYLDLRLPGRPAVGGLAAETVEPVAPADTYGAPLGTATATGTTASGTTGDPTTATGVTPSATGVTPSATGQQTSSGTVQTQPTEGTTEPNTADPTAAGGGAAAAP
jgi:cell division protein FtsQ